MGDRSSQINLTTADTGEQVHQLASPITFAYTPTANELARAGGDPARLRLASWSGGQWVPLPCTSAPDGSLTCMLPHLSVFAVLVLPSISGPLDWDVAGGHLYKQANGFGGAGDSGFGVMDDSQASFWTELQRYGGVERVGYPITRRFWHGGFLTQAFQKLVLQWRPDLGQAVPVNVLDDLNQQGADAWLDGSRQVPPAAGTSSDRDVDWAAVGRATSTCSISGRRCASSTTGTRPR